MRILFSLLIALPVYTGVGGSDTEPSPPAARTVVAIQAGTIHPVAGPVIHNGTVLVKAGKIDAVGAGIRIPPGARVVDYGPDAVIVPGLVAANSGYGAGAPSPRTADPTVMAVDNFDSYSDYYPALTAGITTLYVAPASGRLIAGQGAVVKSAAGESGTRILSSSAMLHGSISAEARNTPGYWEPPVPATVDVGIGLAVPQLPRTTMGAVVALSELLALGRGGAGADTYGPDTGPALAAAMEQKRPWRIRAQSSREIRALLDFFGDAGVPWILDGGAEAGDLAQEIAAAKVPVIVTHRPLGGDGHGRGPDGVWPRFDAAARLVDAGVPIAVAPMGRSVETLRFAAGLAQRGGLPADAALRAITLAPAQILGVANRVGSLEAGKDADLLVLTGDALASESRVTATWIDGEIAWKAHTREAVVLEVEELFVGDGEVLTPGQILMEDGVISEVGGRVAHPRGATVIRGRAAMPGMIDALGHLGLEGAQGSIPARFQMSRIVEPGDYGDRRVAQAGVTTVVLASKASAGRGSPTMAYKPAGTDVERMIIADPNALRMTWTASMRAESGDAVKKSLAKALEYKAQWEKYEKEIAAWKAPAEKAAAKEGEEASEEKGDAAEPEEKAEEPKKKKRKKGEEEPARPVTGTWKGEVSGAAVHLRLLDEDGTLAGNLRCSALAGDLVQLAGQREEKAVSLEGRSSKGLLRLTLTLAGEELSGEANVGEETIALTLKQEDKEWVVAERPERRREETEKPPKGMPRKPNIDPDLEPLRQAMLGRGAVIVSVSREDEIVDCVETFEEHGIKPVLYDADHAYRVAQEIKGRVAGVLLSKTVLARDPEKGTQVRHRFAELASAGIPVAFHSAAEEGAVDLPLFVAYAVSEGMSPEGALRALTADAADMMAIAERVGRLEVGKDADVLLLDGRPLSPATNVLRVWVSGEEVRTR